MRLAFKETITEGFLKKTTRDVYTDRDVEITLKIATLEELCDDLGIEFYDMGDQKKITPYDFMTGLLYYGYVIACKDKYHIPIYTKEQAIVWNEKLSQTARAELQVKIDELIGKYNKSTGSKKKINIKQLG